MSTIAVIIPCYNVGKYLPATLESVSRQTVRPHEVLVIDDGSTDDTPDVCRRASGVRYLRKENGGVSSARNAGLTEVTSRWVLFLDGDDVLRSYAVETLREAQTKVKNDVRLIFGTSMIIDGGGRSTASGFPDPAEMRSLAEARIDEDLYLLSHRLLKRQLRNNVILQGCALVERTVFDQCGVFDESLRSAEDQEMWLRVLSRFRAAYLDRPLLDYRKHEGQLSGPDRWIRNRHNILEVLERTSSASWADRRLRRMARRQYARTSYHLANRYADEGRFGEAAQALLRGLRKSPIHPKGWIRFVQFALSRKGSRATHDT